MQNKWKYVWSVTAGSIITSTLILVGLWVMLGAADSGERGMGAGMLAGIFGTATGMAAVVSVFTAFISGSLIYRVDFDPKSLVGDSTIYGVVSGVILVLLLIPITTVFQIFAHNIDWWDGYSYSGMLLVLFLSTITGIGVCLLLAKIRNLFY